MRLIERSLTNLRSIWVILLGASSGVYIGIFQPDYIEVVAPMGKIYLDILKMCILPILITAISISIGRLINSQSGNAYVKRMIAVFFVSVLIASLLGTATGLIAQPGKGLDEDSLGALGSIIQQSGSPDIEIFLYEPYLASDKGSLIENFFFNLVPSNIFNALSNGSNLKVLFFAIIFGCAVGSLKKDLSEHVLTSLDAIYAAFAKLVQWLMYFLPFGLCGLIASNLGQVGYGVLLAMMKFLPVVFVSFFILFIFCCTVMRIRTGSFFGSLFALKEPILVALGTSNGLASLPSALTAMNIKLGYDKQTVDLLVPLAFTLCRVGPTLYFALATMFVAQLYGVHLGVEGLLIVFSGSILAGMASAGSSGIALLTMLGLVLTPLGLPLDAVIVLFIVIDPIVAPFRVLAIVHSACTLATVIMPKKSNVND